MDEEFLKGLLLREAGTKKEKTDLSRDPNSSTPAFDRNPGDTGRRPTCTGGATVGWRARGFSAEDSFFAISSFVASEIGKVNLAAAKLCTDPECPKASIKITYYNCKIRKNTKPKDGALWNDQFIIDLTLQLEVRCSA